MATFLSGTIESYNLTLNRSTDLNYLRGIHKWQASIRLNLNDLGIAYEGSSPIEGFTATPIHLLFYEDEDYLDRFVLGLLFHSQIHIRLPIRDYQRTIDLLRNHDMAIVNVTLDMVFRRPRIMAWNLQTT